MKNLYLYLASRSKKGMKLITVLTGEATITSKITDLKTLNLPQIWEKRIGQIIYDNRMLYEPWIESANDFNELKKRLQGRGYTDLPYGPHQLLQLNAYASAPRADTSNCNIKKTMTRRGFAKK